MIMRLNLQRGGCPISRHETIVVTKELAKVSDEDRLPAVRRQGSVQDGTTVSRKDDATAMPSKTRMK